MDVKSPSALLYIAISIMHANTAANTIVPEILYLNDGDIIQKLIHMFGGSTIYIPTMAEFIKDLHVVLYGYFSLAEDRTDEWFMANYDIDGNGMRSIKTRLKKWIDTCTESELEFIKLIPGAVDLR